MAIVIGIGVGWYGPSAVQCSAVPTSNPRYGQQHSAEISTHSGGCNIQYPIVQTLTLVHLSIVPSESLSAADSQRFSIVT